MTSSAPPSPLQAWLDEDAELVRQHRLRPESPSFCSEPSSGTPPRGVILMLHGFTAGPWQFRPLADHLNQLGFTCFAARLPGHGAATVRSSVESGAAQAPPAVDEDGTLLPRSRQGALFAACADRALHAAEIHANALGLPLDIIGFSAGGAMALDLLRRRQQAFRRAVLIAPLMRPQGWRVRLFFWLLRYLPGGAFISDRWRFGWQDGPRRDDGWRRPGHNRFVLGNVFALFRYAALTAPRAADNISVPCQFICTATDTKVDNRAALAFAARHPDQHHFFMFGAQDNIPHAMLTPEENPDSTSRQTLFTLISTFLVSGHGSGRFRSD